VQFHRLWFALTLCIAIFHTACVFRFSNAERNIDSSYRRIYVPSVADSSTRGGNSARVSQALRRQLALDTRFELVPADQARLAVDVRIVDTRRVTTKISECVKDSDTVASTSRLCADLKNNFAVPDASSEEETFQMDAQVRILDLSSGKTLYSKSYQNISSGAYDIVGNTETKAPLQKTPELHSLRYAENSDAAIAVAGRALANEIVTALLTLDTSDPTPTPTPIASAAVTATPQAAFPMTPTRIPPPKTNEVPSP
jgi:hypothetical protein